MRYVCRLTDQVNVYAINDKYIPFLKERSGLSEKNLSVVGTLLVLQFKHLSARCLTILSILNKRT